MLVDCFASSKANAEHRHRGAGAFDILQVGSFLAVQRDVIKACVTWNAPQVLGQALDDRCLVLNGLRLR